MSFWTKLFFCRPTKPPMIRGVDLADFIGRLRQVGISDDDPAMPASIRFGEAIDQDAREMTYEESIGPLMSVIKRRRWDYEQEIPGLDALCRVLRHEERVVYRAEIELGGMPPDLIDALAGSQEERNLHLCGWSLSIGPQSTGTMASEEFFLCGWIGVGMFGNGYLYPLSVADLVGRAKTHPRLVELAQCCRAMWPVEGHPVATPPWWLLQRKKRIAFDMQGGPPSRRLRGVRERMGELWQYPVDEPHDWFWAVAESG